MKHSEPAPISNAKTCLRTSPQRLSTTFCLFFFFLFLVRPALLLVKISRMATERETRDSRRKRIFTKERSYNQTRGSQTCLILFIFSLLRNLFLQPSEANDVWIWVRRGGVFFFVLFILSCFNTLRTSDDISPNPDSVDLVEDIMMEYLQEMVRLL
jgi:hypothetical protein